MRKILNIGDQVDQRHTVLFENDELVLFLNYWPTTQRWTLGVEYQDFRIYNVALAVGVLHMVSANQPFDFVVRDNSGSGIDPFQRDDFLTNRCELFILDPDDIAEVRGVEVQF